jgi:hypothetical protein
MPATSPRRRASASPSEERGGRSEQVLPPLRVRYWRRMSRQRVYRVSVSWQKSSRYRPPRDAEPVTVRLVMAGAQVVPSEQTLDPTDPDAKVTFYVTPLARGWLRAERIEVLVGGRKVQEIALPSKVVGQKTTWILFFLSFIIPWFMYQYLVVSPIQDVRENMPAVPAVVADNFPFVVDASDASQKLIAENYERLIVLTKAYQLPAYTLFVLLLLTIISWFTHRNKCKRRIGQPVPLPRGAED